MDLQGLRSRLTTFDGFDLEPGESADLLNEARREFALRSRYPRKTKEIATSVADQAAYAWPEDLLLPLNVIVGGVHFEASDRETVRKIERGELTYSGRGLYYDAADETGERKLILFPAPSETGQAIELEWVFRPVPLVEDSDAPSEFPEEFHPRLLHFVAATYYQTVEDNPELAQVNAAKADLAVSELQRYDNLRATGEGPWQVPIAGITS